MTRAAGRPTTWPQITGAPEARICGGGWIWWHGAPIGSPPRPGRAAHVVARGQLPRGTPRANQPVAGGTVLSRGRSRWASRNNSLSPYVGRGVSRGPWRDWRPPVESSPAACGRRGLRGVGVRRAFWTFLNLSAHARLSCAAELINNGVRTAWLVYALSIDDAIMCLSFVQLLL